MVIKCIIKKKQDIWNLFKSNFCFELCVLLDQDKGSLFLTLRHCAKNGVKSS